MNCFKCAKALLFCISFIGTFTVFYWYSTGHEFKGSGPRWRASPVVANEPKRHSESLSDSRIPVTLEPKASPQKRSKLKKPPVKEEAAKPEKPKMDSETLYLAPNATLKLVSSKTEKWSAEAWKMVEDELKWSKRAGTKAEPGRNISVYSANCYKALRRTKLPALKLSQPNGLIFVDDPIVTEDTIADGKKTVALATLPCILGISRSVIYGAKKGVFPKVDLPRGVIFGQYKGEYVTTFDESEMAKSSYAWEIGFTNEGLLYVDARNESKSNWLRFVNCARFEEEQNLYPLYVEGEIYYLLYKDVPADTELLVWYGRNYGTQLGLWFLSNSTGPTGLAAPRSQIVCPTCRGLPTVEEVSNQSKGRHRSEKMEA